MSFKIGDKVLCIDDSKQRGPREFNVKIGEIYTVEIFNSKGTGIQVREIFGLELKDGKLIKWFYYNWRFIKWNPEEEIESLKEKEGLTIKI